MNRLGLVAIVVCASACDIVGNVPADVTPTVDAFQAACTGTNPSYGVVVKIDASVSEGDEVHIRWSLMSRFAFRPATFRPVLDCGAWTGRFDEGFNSGELVDVSPDPHASYNEAVCARLDGPPRQIVTLRGAAVLPANSSTNDTLDVRFDVSPCTPGESSCDSSFGGGDSQTPRCDG
ncbi:MAG TPA: hypothetical protein VGM90_02830 [Kofleriaceae bacterium]